MAIPKLEWEHFVNQVRVKLPGSSDAGIKAETFDAIREFLKDSDAWTETLTIPILVATSTNENRTYTMIPQHGGNIIRLVGVWDPNLVPIPAFMPFADEDGKGVQLVLVNSVNTAQDFSVSVAKNIALPAGKDDVPIAPSWLFTHFGSYIQDGVLGRMMGQLAKSYSNSTSSVYHLRRFRDGIAQAKSQTRKQNTFGAQAWSFPQGFAAGGQRGGVSTANPSRF
jgi:hypothetical protein